MSRIFPCLLFLLLAACSSSDLGEARARLKKADVPLLRADAARLYARLHASPGPEFMVLKPGDWPESFKQLKPIRIGSYEDGFAFILSGVAGSEAGLHIQPEGMDKMPEAKLFRYERLDTGIFAFQAKKR